MGFYYITSLSIVPLAIAYAAVAILFTIAFYLTRGMRLRRTMLAVLAMLFMLLPVSEELWVAWNFGRACKTAGTVIHRKVHTEGFYDSTTRSAYENTRNGYKFVEHPTDDRRGVERVEKADKESAAKAVAWYVSQNPGRPLPKSVTQPVDSSSRFVTFTDTGEVWRIIRLERPTARYHFQHTDPMDGTPWAHKILRAGSVVVDTETNSEVARYTSFARLAPWFYVGMGAPEFACDTPGAWPSTKSTSLIYRDALIPARAQ